MNHIGDFKLDQKQIEFICGAINMYGDGEHPVADAKTFKYFTTEYVKDILTRQHLLKNLSTTGQETINGVNLILYPTIQLEVPVNSLWDYDGSLCASKNRTCLKVKAVENGIVRFYERMGYEGYSIQYFNGDTFKPHEGRVR